MYKVDECLNCGTPISSGLFCSSCYPKLRTDVGEDTLPPELEEDTIEKMGNGEIGYTVPWAMFADSGRKLFIVGTYSVHQEPGGTVQMRVKMGNNTVLVDRRTVGDHKYVPSEPAYHGTSSYLPVRLVEGF